MNRRWKTQLAIGLAFLVSPAAALADAGDTRFLEGLRERRLFELAEAYCADRLGRFAQDNPTRAELTTELIRTLSLHAINAAPHERAELWNKARTTAATFLRQSPPDARAILVRFQDALTLLAQGELGRQEFEAGLLPGDQVEAVRQTLRQATAALESLDKELTAAIPLRRRSAAKGGELTADELTSLAQQVQHQLANAQRDRAMLFERGSDDRVALLLAAVGTLERLLMQASNHETLKAAVQLDLAECQRLLGRYSEAVELVVVLDQELVPGETRLKARAELIRVAVSKKDMP